ncbi:MAG: UDP-N-acetylmuramoyl-L-alanyl-D-glutamate--2,6-diaminopimelate ligase [Coriobacteriales bacterium]|jgi:UDP-N-acetylmuramoyl-L-alanyl-D-glutamate--2,6-diaminopimelate ligase
MTQGKRITGVAEMLAGMQFEAVGAHDVEATGLAYRSDRVEPGGVFFCIPGLKRDGHDFAADAVSRGCAALVVQRKLPLDVPQFVVADSRRALAIAASRFYGMPSEQLDVVGITGTNGKTTTTFLVDWAARSRGLKTGLIGTVETRIGDEALHADHTTPESLDLQALFAQMGEAGCQEVTMEVSSHAIDLNRILGTRFAVAAFSNLTQDHLDYHETMENYFEAKAALFTPEYTGKAAICIDDRYGEKLAARAADLGLDVVTTGFEPAADIRVLLAKYHATHTALTISAFGETYSFDYPLIGRFNVENIALALGICHQLGYDLGEVCHAMEHAPQAPGRMERVSLPGKTARETYDATGISVFVDYAHTPDSIEKAIAALKPITSGRLITVFGCGGDRDRTKRPKMGAASCASDLMVVTSDNPRTEDPDTIIADILPGMRQGTGRYEVIADRRAAIFRAIEMAEPGDGVLIAGKGHEDYQLVGDKVLDFDDRIVAREALEALVAKDGGAADAD